MAQNNTNMANLINYTVSEDHERPDLEACLEISDRVNGSKPECVEAISTMTKSLAKPSLKVVLNTLQLLETLCKNCNMRFLYELNNKKLVDALMKILEKRLEKNKLKWKTSKTSKPTDKYRVQVEDKVLYLIQLWADTFMMHQEEFKNIHDVYRTLRKEGVKFPDRDPNEKFMMNFQGTVSPIFLAMDENYIVPSNNQGGPLPDPNKLQSQPKTIHKGPEYQHEVNPNSMPQNTLYNEDEEYDYTVYDGIEITRDEVKVIEESIGILKEIEVNAAKPGDMKSEIANEILGDLVHVHKRVTRLILIDKFSSNSQRNEAIKLNDKINESLLSYRTRYNYIKDCYNKGVKVESLVSAQKEENQEEVQSGTENKGGESEDKSTKKGGFVGVRRLAPPKGWKAPVEKNENDFIDLLGDNAGGAQEEGTPQHQNQEEQKTQTQTPKPSNEKHNYLDDLLNLEFISPTPYDSTPTRPVTNNNSNPLSGLNFAQAQPNQLNFMGSMSQSMGGQPAFNQFPSAFPQGIVQPQFAQPVQMPFSFSGGFPIMGQPNMAQSVNNTNGFHQGLSPISPLKTQQQTTNEVKTPVQGEVQGNQNAFGDDDDFFSDIANRKK